LSLGDEIDINVLKEALELHKKELKLIRNMSDAQFENFRKNFSIGQLEDISRGEAIALLSNMIGTNLRMQEIIRREK
jgi:hypothetical protein